MSSKACLKCKSNVTPKQSPGICCVDCKKPCHWKCTGLTPQEQSTIIKKSLSWTCSSCKRRSIILTEPASSSQDDSSNRDLSAKIAQLERANKSLEDLLTAAISRIDSLEAKLNEKSAQIETVTSEVHRIEATADNIEKNLVDFNLEIQNLSDSDLDDPTSAAIRVGAAIGCPVAPSDFKSPPLANRKRLHLTFISKTVRKNFFLAGKQFNRANKRFQNKKIHINEQLTASQSRLYEATLKFKNAHNYKFCWFGISGQLLLKKDEHSLPHVIHSPDSLKNEALLSESTGNQNEVAGVPPINQTPQ